MKPCFPGAHSGMNKFTPLISLGNHVNSFPDTQPEVWDFITMIICIDLVLTFDNTRVMTDEYEMKDEYDFSTGVRGRFHNPKKNLQPYDWMTI